MSQHTPNDCPCGSRESYARCCGRYISGLMQAPTPEALMRSRYTAYTLANIAYIAHTMKGPAALGFDPKSAKSWAETVRWNKLEVLNAHTEGDKGEVTFKAYFTHQKKPQIMLERSVFERIDGRWFYVDRLDQ